MLDEARDRTHHFATRLGYILWRVATDVVSLLSRAVNAFLFGGSTAQTLSARAYQDSLTSAKWARRRRIIDAIFFWDRDHCRRWYHEDIERMRHALRVYDQRASGGDAR